MIEASISSAQPFPPLNDEDQQLIYKIRAITCKGNDAEVRRKKDGSLMVYEVKKKAV